MYRSVCLALFAAIFPGTAFAAPLDLEPSSRWNLSYDAEACRLGRTFGDGDDKIVAQFIRYMPGPGFEMIVSGKPLEPRGTKFEYRFAPGDDADEAQNPLFGRGEEGLTMWQFNTGLIPHDEVKKLDEDVPEQRSVMMAREKERAPQVRSFEILKGTKQQVSLQIGSLADAMEAMDTCMDDLVREWGHDPEVQRGRLSNPVPKINPGRWITTKDYPSGPLRDGLSGVVRFRLDIDETGAVSSCTIQESYSVPAFREATCKLIEKKARFAPAIGADGKPVKSFWGTAVVFVAG